MLKINQENSSEPKKMVKKEKEKELRNNSVENQPLFLNSLLIFIIKIEV